MRHKKIPALWLFGGLLLVIGIVLWVPAIYAQCGSETSTCKNCHEVQGQDPVNKDGTGWHESHAFGDFCYLCHAGNQQAPDKAAAHEGMVPPLSDVKASCQSCHPTDVAQRAAVYAKVLGVEVGTGASAPNMAALTEMAVNNGVSPTEQAQAAVASTPVATQAEVCAPGSTQLAVDDPNVVNYVQNYEEIVLGQHPANLGNIALVGIIALIALGGGGFVVFNEVKLRHSAADTTVVEAEYPADVVDLLPGLTNLKAKSRKSLKNILDNPEKSDKVLGLIDEVVSDDKE